MRFRHEWKHEITYGDMLALQARLGAVLQRDSHAAGGAYLVRSLYFDDLRDTALREKLEGVDRREKFRIRLYNGDGGFILLEKKSKRAGLCAKEQARLTVGQAQALSQGHAPGLMGEEPPLLRELCYKMGTKGLQPKTIVDYTRVPFVYAPGNVRVTLDYDIRTALSCTDLLDPNCVTVPAGNAPAILEVKWDEFLPGLVRDLVQTPGTHTGAFSKYAASRMRA